MVNEALNEDGTWRESVFYKVLGEDYIKLAFKLAHEIDPETKLYYNDYNIERPGRKADGVRRIVRMLQEEGIPIHGVGMQAHFMVGRTPSLDDQIHVIKQYAELGMEVALTELDIRGATPVTADILAQQKVDYMNVSTPPHILLY